MNSNNLLEFGGLGQVFITAICDFTIHDKKFKKGDVVFYFDSVNINFTYGHTTSSSVSKREQIYYSEFFLNSFSIDTAPFNFNFDILTDNSTELNVYEVEQSLSMDNRIILKGLPLPDTVRIKNIENFNVEIINDIAIIYSEEFEHMKKYDVVYQKKIDAKNMLLDNATVDIPYLKAQIKFEGNKEKIGNVNYITVPKTALHITPVFNLINDEVSHIRLLFRVLDGESTPMLSVV